ncbi:TM0106 family RecB-like putative nuclease [Oryzihumus leptocrescens]
MPALLQMATYAERLTTLQGVAPRHLVVVTGDKEQHPWRLVDVAPYARLRRAALLDAIKHQPDTEPAPVGHCVQCRWQERCEQEWLDTDDLVQVAGMRSDQREALRANGITTLKQLAQTPEAEIASILTRQTAGRLSQQARLQLAEREGEHAAYELLTPEPGRGLQRLPDPSPGDVYLDFEGDPWAEGGAGREYLAGIWDRSGTFTAFWAHDFDQEKQLTEDLVDELLRRWHDDPGMHIYHYAPYERTALARLTGRHGTREAELDQLLRGERLVDLYAVVRQGVRISKGSYSIKKLEDFYWGHTRHGEDDQVADAMSSVIEYERWLVDREDGVLERIADYNRDDVRSTHDLHAWLEERRDELAAAGHELQRPQPPEVEEISDAERAETELAEALVDAGHELLAGCVGWHRREARPAWWEFFRYADLDTEDLIEDATAIGAPGEPAHVDSKLSKAGKVTSRVWRYPFPTQDFKLKVGDYAQDVDTHTSVGKVCGFHPVEGWVDLSMKASAEPCVPRGFGPPGPLNDGVLRDSIAAVGTGVLAGEDSMGARLVAGVVPPADALAARPGEAPADVVVRVGLGLRGEVLAVQGPPGTGKTYAAAHLIRALLDAGKKVGVTALSHAVIRHVLTEVKRPALHKVGDLPESGEIMDGQVRLTKDNGEAVNGLADGSVRLVGGTAWLWARPEMREAVDVLVIDEAGQFSLANAVAVAGAAKSLVLLGDPQQLTQPTQATHPYGAGVSALEHLIGEHDTVPEDCGVFLGTTFRMHPEVTRFVSELSYDGRLASAPHRERQVISGEGPLSGAGLRWVPVAHDGREATSIEEATVVAALIEDLLTRCWTDPDGVTRPLTLEDVLVVAPFNAHVATLHALAPDGIRVGTVDKFQGQQAPVVIYSMASSSAALAPRGVDFLYDLHRLNVALSRAKAMSIVVASPALLDAEVHTPEQLRAVNALCRYVEDAAVPGELLLGDVG